MQIAGTILTIYGVVCLYMLVLRPPWVVNNFKVKIMIKKMGVKGFWIFFTCWTFLALGLGITFLLIA